MRSTLRFLAALYLCVQLSFGQLTEVGRVCDRVPCQALQNDTLTLSCGISGERITQVIFASYGAPVGTCPVEGTIALPPSAYNFTSTPGCNLNKSFELINKACVTKVTCEVDVAELLGSESAGLESCPGNGVGFSVVVKCTDQLNAFTILISGVVAAISFALGATVTIELFKDTFRKHGRAVIIGWCCQFGFMPLIAYLFVTILEITDPLVALGYILAGASPGGATSNLLTYYANGNVALSITMSAASTTCALFMIPLLLYIYGTLALGFSDLGIPFLDIFLALLIIIVPVSLGVAIRERDKKWAKRIEIGGSILGALFILAALVVGVIQNPDLFNASKFQKSWLAAALFQPIAGFLGFVAATLFKLSGPELRAVVLETAIQNYPIGIAVATISFSGCERIAALTFLLLATFWYLLNSIWITGLLRYYSRYDTKEEEKEYRDSVKIADSL